MDERGWTVRSYLEHRRSCGRDAREERIGAAEFEQAFVMLEAA